MLPPAKQGPAPEQAARKPLPVPERFKNLPKAEAEMAVHTMCVKYHVKPDDYIEIMKGGGIPLIRAISQNNLNMVRLLIEFGANAHVINDKYLKINNVPVLESKEFFQVLMDAAEAGHEDVVKFFIDKVGKEKFIEKIYKDTSSMVEGMCERTDDHGNLTLRKVRVPGMVSRVRDAGGFEKEITTISQRIRNIGFFLEVHSESAASNWKELKEIIFKLPKTKETDELKNLVNNLQKDVIQFQAFNLYKNYNIKHSEFIKILEGTFSNQSGSHSIDATDMVKYALSQDSDNPDMIMLLLDLGADPWKTLELCAAKNKHPKTLKALVEKSGDYPDKLLLQAAKRGEIESVKNLLGAGVPATPKQFYHAAKREHVKVLEEMIKAGFDVSKLNAYQLNAYQLMQTGKVMIEVGAGAVVSHMFSLLNQTSKLNFLVNEAGRGNLEVLEYLIKAKAVTISEVIDSLSDIESLRDIDKENVQKIITHFLWVKALAD